LEFLSKQPDINATLHGLPDTVNTPELQIKLRGRGELRTDRKIAGKCKVRQSKEKSTPLTDSALNTPTGFGLMRASNTTPVIVLRFEADTEPALKHIQEDFRRVLLESAPDISLPF